MKINTKAVRDCLKAFDFQTLFREHLGWDIHKAQLDILRDGQIYSLHAVSQKRGFVAFVCDSIPDRQTRLKIDHQVTKSVREHFVIYADEPAGQQVWHWVRRETGKPLASRDHRFDVSQSGDPLIQRLEHIAVSMEEEETLTLPDIAGRGRAAFDVDKVTKKFYERFKAEHSAFLKLIKGFPASVKKDGKTEPHPDLQWYTSLMLNRLMFVYFMQKKGFLDGDTAYLCNRLAMVQQARGKDKFQSFYRYFLLRLFHDGLGKSLDERKFEPVMKKLLGKIPFLNGGFFEVHKLETEYPDIEIPDEAFEKLFDFFDLYSWHLDERPCRADNEINPDVVGYIFEKYINQKQMGAYYTKEDITEYISKNTILPYLFDAARKKCAVAFKPDSALWRLLQDDPDRYIYPAVRQGVIDEKGDLISLPKDIAAGIKDVSKRDGWNQSAEDPYALPTETWREHVARRQRCLDIREKLSKGEVNKINDLITLNLDIWQFARDAIINAEGPELVRAFWHTLVGRMPEKSNEQSEPGITILDPTCGSGAFLFAALRILETLYSDCLERMERFIEDSGTGGGTGGGTGVSPVNHGQDGRATLQIRQGAYLPHWTCEGATYAVTFRLADSLPRNVVEAWLRERDDIVATARQMNRPLSRSEEDRLRELHSERVETYLDAGHGECWMKAARVAQIVADALKHFDGDRYDLTAWTVMPNHVHAVLEPREGHDIPSILHSWKSFTAKEANRALGRTGQFWQEEYYDHLIRDQQDFAHAIQYTLANSEKAGLKNWQWSSGTGVPPVNHGQDGRATKKYRDFRSILAQLGKHPNERYFILKSIIINNLFGVDIMEEAVEICKLRLFLKLVAQVETADQIEPLPDIDFNIRCGNTLVGFVSLSHIRKAATSESKRDMEGQSQALLGFHSDTIARIEEDAELVNNAFKMFQRNQVEAKADHKLKEHLQERLSKLNLQLDHYLASEYGVDVKKQKDFDAWKASHQPFHWFVEFYGIMHAGGFDVIIGNPPYVEYSKVRTAYQVLHYSTEAASNLYAYITERCYALLGTGASFGFIVPISLICTQRMETVQQLLSSNSTAVWVSNYAERPGKLFAGAEVLLTIALARLGAESSDIFTTGFTKWATDERPALFERANYCRIGKKPKSYIIPKVTSPLELAMLEKLLTPEGVLGKQFSRNSSAKIFYRIGGGRYWKIFTNFQPRFVLNGKRSVSSRESYLYFESEDMRDAAIAVLSSSLFYWYFILTTNCRDLNPSDLKEFPVNIGDLNSATIQRFSKLCDELMTSYRDKSVLKEKTSSLTGRIVYQEFYPRLSKPIIDEIDRALAKHYGLTDEELDFIINYDIKYRMGGADEKEE